METQIVEVTSSKFAQCVRMAHKIKSDAKAKRHFLSLMKLAQEMGEIRGRTPYIEGTWNYWTDADVQEDISIILSQVANCFYAPSNCRIALATAAYYSKLNSKHHTFETINFI